MFRFGARRLNCCTAPAQVPPGVCAWQIWGLLVFFFRSTEIINNHPAMGEVFLVLREMIFDSLPVTLYMLFVATVAGIAFSAAKPIATHGADTSGRNWWALGLWALLGSAYLGVSNT
jgi:hypothetical protein